MKKRQKASKVLYLNFSRGSILKWVNNFNPVLGKEPLEILSSIIPFFINDFLNKDKLYIYINMLGKEKRST